MDSYGDPEDEVFFDGSYSLNGIDHPAAAKQADQFGLAATPAG